MQDNEIDVLIVGAGPVGLMMACLLAMHHIRFRIIDKSPDFSNYSGALILHAASLELFRQLGISGSVMEHGTVLKAINFAFGSRNHYRLDISEIGTRQSEFPFALLIEQGKTEKILARFLEQHDVEVERETTLTDFSEFNDHIECCLSSVYADEKLITGYMVAADGGHSFIRSKLDIPFTGTTHSDSLFAMDCSASVGIPADEALIAISPGATAGFFPLPDGKWRIDGAFSWHDKNAAVTFRDVQQNFKRKTMQKVSITAASWFSLFHSQRKNAIFFSTPRCFLVGDAAHIYSPVGAQGMNHGLQDAANLSWKLAYAIKKWARPCILLSYEPERKQVAEKTALISDRIYNFISGDRLMLKFLRVRIMPLFFNILKNIFKKPAVSRYLFRSISGVGIRYKKSSLSLSGPLIRGPKPGQRMPYLLFTESGKSMNITDQIRLVCMQLFVFCKEKPADDILEKAERFKMQVEWHSIDYSESTRELFEQFKIRKTTFYLVRPDKYIACAGSDPELLETYLYRVLIPDSI